MVAGSALWIRRASTSYWLAFRTVSIVYMWNASDCLEQNICTWQTCDSCARRPLKIAIRVGYFPHSPHTTELPQLPTTNWNECGNMSTLFVYIVWISDGEAHREWHLRKLTINRYTAQWSLNRALSTCDNKIHIALDHLW